MWPMRTPGHETDAVPAPGNRVRPGRRSCRRRAETAYVDGTAAVGGRLATAVMVGRSVFKLRDGQIVLEGASRPGTNPESAGPDPIVGGSGAYEGARGSATTTVTSHGAQTTFRLLP